MNRVSVFLLLAVAGTVWAGLPPTTSKISGDLSNKTTFNYQFPNLSGTHAGTTVVIPTFPMPSPSPSGDCAISDGTSWNAAPCPTGSGTVSTVSVVSSNGLAGTVANATTTPAITLSTSITGILQGNGTAISAATTTGSGSVVLATSPTLTTPSLGSTQIHTVADPTSSQDAATKNYVDTQLAQLNPAAAVVAASTANIAGTYTNAVGGVCIGDTFTTTATTAFALDGYSPSIGSRVLLKNQSSSFQNGVWTLTTQAVGGTSGAILTRATDFDSSTDFNAGQIVPVVNGTANAGSSWYQTAVVSTCSSGSQTWTQFQKASSSYLQVANNLSDVSSVSTAFNNIQPMTTLGDIMYEDVSPSAVRLAGNTSSSLAVLTQTGTGTISAAPVWSTSPALNGSNITTLNGSNISSGTVAAARGGTGISTSASTGYPSISSGTWSVASVANTFITLFETVATTTGDLIYGGSSGTPTKLGIGSNNQVLQVAGGVPTWQTPSSTVQTYWTGHFDKAATFTMTTSTSYADFTSSSGATIATDFSNNLTCTAHGSNIPGVDCTLPNAGGVHVCFTVSSSIDAASVSTLFALTDGSGVKINNSGANQYPSANLNGGSTFCGDYTATTTSLQVKLRAASGAGSHTLTIGAANVSGAGDVPVSISISMIPGIYVPVSLVAHGNVNGATGGNPIIFPTVDKDTNSAYSAGTGQFTAPDTGCYRVCAGFTCSSFTAAGDMYVYVAGSKSTVWLGRPQVSGIMPPACGTVCVNATQTIDVRYDNTLTAGSGNPGSLSITEVH